MARLRIFFVTDVHGSDRCFRKFLNSAKVYGADAIILGGDITGKSLVPILSMGGGTYRLSWSGGTRDLKGDDSLNETVRQIGDSGAYSVVLEPREYEEMHAHKDARDKQFSELIASRLREWMTLAEERLKGTKVRCFISPGNDDGFEVDSILDSCASIVNPEEKVVEVAEGREMITLGFTNRTPWHSPREVDEDVLAQKIEKMAEEVGDMRGAIFNLHVPPINTTIDQAPKVTDDLRYVMKGGQVQMTSAGSSSVREAILKHQPALGLHGHIHESRGIVKLGRTICGNPGSEYGEGILRGLLADLEGEKVRSYLLTSG